METDALGSERRALAVRRFVPCRTIVLVGLMGAGKTKIGRRLAARLSLPFFDSDQEIEAAAGETIEEIFANRGERVFRDGERRVIARLLDRTGPRAGDRRRRLHGPGDPRGRSRSAASRCGCAPISKCLVQRVSRRTDRPLLKTGDPRAILAELIERRHPIYAEADLTVDSGEGSPEATASRVIAALAACPAASRAYAAPKMTREPRRMTGEYRRIACGPNGCASNSASALTTSWSGRD